MEGLGTILLILLLVIFIGNVAYKESFADCNSPGQMTWTISLGPGSSSCSPGGSGGSGKGGSSGSSSSTNTTDGRKADSVKDLKSNSSSDGSSSSSSSSNKKSSGIELSLSDLLALIGSSGGAAGNRNSSPAYNYRYVSASIPQPPAPPAPPAPQVYVIAGSPAKSLNSQFPSDLRTNSLDPVIGAYADANTLVGSAGNFQDNRIPAGSFATRQGVQYVKGAPANNPADNPEYIRKDSIPCYACSL
jgi:hypothetical protein